MKRLVAARAGSFVSVEDLARRARLHGQPMRLLADADAFRSIGLDRRAALWEVRRLPQDIPLPLFAAAQTPELGEERDASLPRMGLGEHVATDYQVMRLSLKAHPMALLRPVFARDGVASCAETSARADGRFTCTAGLVLVRQRPGKGNAIFITLEDETGITNAMLWARDFERLRRPVMAARLMLVEGYVQKSSEGIVHLMASNIVDRSAELDRLWNAHISGLALTGYRGDPMRDGEALAPQASAQAGASCLRAAAIMTPTPRRHPRDARILPKSRDFH